jgi:hypothetical protein
MNDSSSDAHSDCNIDSTAVVCSSSNRNGSCNSSSNHKDNETFCAVVPAVAALLLYLTLVPRVYKLYIYI